MTKEEIIEMARQAGMIPLEGAVNALGKSIPSDWLTNFAKLIAEKERDECWKIADDWGDYDVQGLADAIRAKG